ncbi:rRNA processing/ribosome biogenesis-domain-containing protein [Pisolithus albus]|nr:rRNA processing/ribosome biogenesis-domain-containing protein [Pisolithus albus]
MDVPHPLQSILQSFLVSDASAVLFARQVLERLSPGCLAPSSHLQKWCTRITSLMHSKDPGARWAGICFAYRTSALSEDLLVEHARSWIGIVLPLLSKPEPTPILKISMRYLRLVLCAAVGHPEFQRQVAAPAVSKISAALLHIAENSFDANIRVLATQVLSQLVMSYPSQHRALSSKLFALCYSVFGGSSPQPTDGRLLDVTTDLFSTLHYLGGKVGGANTWRSCLDVVLHASWAAWTALRTTFPNSMTHLSGNMEGTAPSYFGSLPADPLVANALCLDRLACNITAICALLRAPVQRPVKVPAGSLVTFSYALLACTGEEQQAHHILITRKLLTPSASRLIMTIACQLERNQEKYLKIHTIIHFSRRSAFLRVACDILNHCSVFGSSIAVARLMKATIVSLSQFSLPQSVQGGVAPAQFQSKTGKKRVREFQDGDALSTRQQVLCATSESCSAVLVALDVIHEVLRNVELPQPVRSLSTRVLLSLLLSLPSTPPQSLSHDLNVYNRIVKRVREICLDNVLGTSEMSRFVELVLRCCTPEGGQVSYNSGEIRYSYVDLLIHPRRPPPTQRLPSLDFLSLSSVEDGKDEAGKRQVHDLPQRSAAVRGTSPVVLEKSGSTAPVPSLVQGPSAAPRPLEPDRPTNMLPPKSPPLTDNVPNSHDIPMVTCTAPHPSPPRVQPLPAVQQQQTQKPVIAVPPTLAADEDNEDLPSIDMDSDSDM